MKYICEDDPLSPVGKRIVVWRDVALADSALGRSAMYGANVVRRFHLLREYDISGVSGVGRIAVGCEFPDGRCVLMWLSPVLSQEPYGALSIYASIHELLAVHGHGGHTTVEWFDE